MAASNHRIKDYGTVHHLTSRIAHRVYFLKEEERNDFIEIMLRVAEFCGIELVGWCIMANHFHILAYLPKPPESISNEEIIRRYGLVAGIGGRESLLCEFDRWEKQGDTGAKLMSDAILRLRARMYSISWFMKMLKQWFTEEYNRRNGHKGTMWEATYHDRVLAALTLQDTRDCLCYIHLNPIRAAITPDFDGYGWSSLCAFKRGDSTAIKGMRLVYGETLSVLETLAIHHERMAELLEAIKLKRAAEIARKRAAGYAMPCDVLTSESMIAQAAANRERIQRALIDLHAERELTTKVAERQQLIAKEIEMTLEMDPEVGTASLAERTGLSLSTVQRYVRKLRQERGVAA